MFQFNLTPQEKNVILAIAFAALVGMGIGYLFKVMPKAEAIYSSQIINKPAIPSKVNLNTATLADLIKLPGIGVKTAERIIEYRLKNGKISSVEELKNIKGLSVKKIEKMKGFLVVE